MADGGRAARETGSSREAHRAAVPPRLRTHSQLSRVDYQDAFAIESASVPARTPEQWAGAVIESSSPRGGQALWSIFSGLGVLPRWELRAASDDVAVLGGSSGMGLSAELLFECRKQTLLLATLVRSANPGARAAWMGLSLVHRRVVPLLLKRATT